MNKIQLFFHSQFVGHVRTDIPSVLERFEPRTSRFESPMLYNIGVNHGFQCSNIRWIARKVFEHKAAGRL